MAYGSLPTEILSSIFKCLHLADLVSAGQVCKQWYYATLDHKLWSDVAVVLHDDATKSMATLKDSQCMVSHYVLREVDLHFNSLDFWKWAGPKIQHLHLYSCDVSERLFIDILSECRSLQSLGINGCNGLFISGTLFEKHEDIVLIETRLQDVIELDISCNRYLSDALFNRLVRIVPKLQRLSLAGCQISFHPAIYRRFYPRDGTNAPSGSVLTFQNIITFVKSVNKTIKSLNFGRTLIDSRALSVIAGESGLELEELHLMSCEQLSKSGIVVLCEHQKQLKVLDLSMSYQIPDQAIICICENLSELCELSIRRCHNVTDRSISAISKLKKLQKLNVSSCEKITPVGFKLALCTPSVSGLWYLNLSYCNVTDEVVVRFVEFTPHLLHLDLTSCVNITNTALNSIAKSLVKLRTLRIAWCRQITDDGVIGQSTEQQESNIRTNGGVMDVLAHSNANKSLNDSIPNDFWKDISDPRPLKNVTGLRELDLCGCVNIGDKGIKFGISFLELNYLNLSLCHNITDEGLMAIGSNNPSIETLILSQCHQITDIGITAVVKTLPRLRHLDLQGCKHITDATLRNLRQYSKALRYLDVSLCENITLEAAEYVEICLPNLHTVHKRQVKSAKTEERCDF